MCLKFEDSYGIKYLKSGGFSISVSNLYQNSYPGETKQTQTDKIIRMLNGEKDLSVMYTNCNGESEFRITNDDKFVLRGGEYGPTFGDIVKIEVSYSENKIEIDKFLKFMMQNE